MNGVKVLISYTSVTARILLAEYWHTEILSSTMEWEISCMSIYYQPTWHVLLRPAKMAGK